ncbi:MAG: hypothetical protein KKH44_07720 [Bacteroidetes bacterium]|nr:hypothetical protein [Bacteroidota bacterium]
MTYIDKYNDAKAGIELLEVLEIQGDNPHINKLKSEARKELKIFLEKIDVDWLVGFLLEARKQATKSS